MMFFLAPKRKRDYGQDAGGNWISAKGVKQ